MIGRFAKDRVLAALAVTVLVLILVEAVFVPHKNPKFPWHHVPGYAAMIGLFGGIVVVVLSKWLGKAFLQRPEADE